MVKLDLLYIKPFHDIKWELPVLFRQADTIGGLIQSVL